MATRRDRYHHGDVRRAAVAAAIEELEAHGHEAFTLERVARRVGVTAPAIYRHFAGREALLKAVLFETFVGFVAQVDGAVLAATDPAGRVRALGVTYVRFALDHPGWFRLQFSRAGVEELLVPHEDAHPKYPELAFAALRELVGDDPQEQQRAYLVVWATAHGIASLIIEGMFGAGPTREERYALGDSLIDQSLRWTRDRR